MNPPPAAVDREVYDGDGVLEGSARAGRLWRTVPGSNLGPFGVIQTRHRAKIVKGSGANPPTCHSKPTCPNEAAAVS
jgi:hypothetical protein